MTLAQQTEYRQNSVNYSTDASFKVFAITKEMECKSSHSKKEKGVVDALRY